MSKTEQWARDQLAAHLLPGEQLGPLAALVPSLATHVAIDNDPLSGTAIGFVGAITSQRRLLLLKTMLGLFGRIVREPRGVIALSLDAVAVREKRRSLVIEDPRGGSMKFRKKNKSRQFPTQAEFFAALAAR